MAIISIGGRKNIWINCIRCIIAKVRIKNSSLTILNPTTLLIYSAISQKYSTNLKNKNGVTHKWGATIRVAIHARLRSNYTRFKNNNKINV